MTDKSKVIFGNPIKRLHSARRKKPSANMRENTEMTASRDYSVKIAENACLYKPLGVYDIRVDEGSGGMPFDREKGLIVGNIRMGFGHYRISIAMASAAHALGYTPYWMDLNSFSETTCTKVIGAQNDLYSLGSRISQRSRLFNKVMWEPLNYEGFRQLSYNSADQKNAELMATVFRNIPKDIPVDRYACMAGAGGDTRRYEACGQRHTRQLADGAPSRGGQRPYHPDPPSLYRLPYPQRHAKRAKFSSPCRREAWSIRDTISTTSLSQTSRTTATRRLARKRKAASRCGFLLTIGGAGAQRELFAAVIRHLIPMIRRRKAALYINVGDYKKVWDELCMEVKGLQDMAKTHFNDWEKTESFAEKAIDGDVYGIHAFWHENIFEAVYCTNLLMRSCDVLVTKPSELAFYPIPKLFLKRIGGHEKWGAIHSAEMGDGTLECTDVPHTLQMLDMFLNESELFVQMCQQILVNKSVGLYDGAYKVVELAMRQKQK